MIREKLHEHVEEPKSKAQPLCPILCRYPCERSFWSEGAGAWICDVAGHGPIQL